MTRHFDPIRKRQTTLELLHLSLKADGFRPACHAVDDAVYAQLCGLPGQAHDILEAVLPALEHDSALGLPHQQAETNQPRWYWLYGDESDRLCHLGLAHWMLTGAVPHQEFEQAADCCGKSIEAGYETFPHPDPMELDLFMLAAVLARADAAALAFYGKHERDGAKPIAPGAARSERRLCQAICRHRVEGVFAVEALRKTTDSLIRRHADPWLADGHPDHLAYWLLVRFHELEEGGATPEQLLRRAYDYLPGLQPPGASRS